MRVNDWRAREADRSGSENYPEVKRLVEVGRLLHTMMTKEATKIVNPHRHCINGPLYFFFFAFKKVPRHISI